MYPTAPVPRCGTADAVGRLELPQTLHGQLFLLAYDRCRDRLDGNDRWRFGLALRTAMLTDLYMSGHLMDDDDRPRPVDGTRPCDPLLQAVLDDIADNEPKYWMHAVARDQRNTAGLVRSQLETQGWLWVQRRRILGIVPSARQRLHNEDLVMTLSGAVIVELRNAIAGRPSDARPLAVGPQPSPRWRMSMPLTGRTSSAVRNASAREAICTVLFTRICSETPYTTK
jgi:hypothetical protein